MDRKLLIVDDERSIRDLFQQAFGPPDYQIHLAENGEQALDILKRNHIDLIFLDLKLFGMNGIELCRMIRKDKPISIIYAITGWAGLFEVEECREAGFDDFFTKPVKLDVIFKAVENAFEKLDRWARRFPA
ncbi:MAG: response regulator [Deltaproteobacteria bacterium]|nr:response regulator [Deltaproteobacteria bacterium]